MTERTFQIVQFVHPGFEYPLRRAPERVMDWKPGGAIQNRKFLLANGSYVDAHTPRDPRSAPLVFWGEWEGPSVYWRVESSGRPSPSFIHAPFRPPSPPATPFQNIDPMVFGDASVYSNCLQPSFPSLRSLAAGSIVLFGRYGREKKIHSFSLDTCLVVERVQTMRTGGEGWGRDLLTDAVLRPLATEGWQGDLTVYFGRSGPARPFSFFPARRFDQPSSLFARPKLMPSDEMMRVITPAKNQGVKITCGLREAQRDAVWQEVARQVTEQGGVLGYYASHPPVIAEGGARASAAGLLAPLEH